MDKPDPRYPFTYAADVIRSCAVEGGVKLSRGEAVRIIGTISSVLGLNRDYVSRRLADHYLANQDAIDELFLHGIPGLALPVEDGRSDGGDW